MAVHSAQLAKVTLHEFSDLIHEDPKAAHAPAVQHDVPPDGRVAVLHQQNSLGVPVEVVLPGALGSALFRPGGPPAGMLVPVRLVPARGLVPTCLFWFPRLADVAPAAVLQRLRAGASGRGGLPRRGLVGSVVDNGIETMVAALVGGHFVPPHVALLAS